LPSGGRATTTTVVAPPPPTLPPDPTCPAHGAAAVQCLLAAVGDAPGCRLPGGVRRPLRRAQRLADRLLAHPPPPAVARLPRALARLDRAVDRAIERADLSASCGTTVTDASAASAVALGARGR